MVPLRQNFIKINFYIIILFAIIYKYLPDGAFNKTNKLDFTEALYLSVTTHTTLGLADIYPVSPLGRLTIAVHAMIMFYLLSDFFIQLK